MRIYISISIWHYKSCSLLWLPASRRNRTTRSYVCLGSTLYIIEKKKSTGSSCMHGRLLERSTAAVRKLSYAAFLWDVDSFRSTRFYISQVARNTQPYITISHSIDLLCRHQSSQTLNSFFSPPDPISVILIFFWDGVLWCWFNLRGLARSTPVAQSWQPAGWWMPTRAFFP